MSPLYIKTVQIPEESVELLVGLHHDLCDGEVLQRDVGLVQCKIVNYLLCRQIIFTSLLKYGLYQFLAKSVITAELAMVMENHIIFTFIKKTFKLDLIE